MKTRLAQIDADLTYPEVPATCFGDAAEWALPGIPAVAVSGAGYADEAITDVVRTRLALASPITLCPQTTDAGDVAVVSSIMEFEVGNGGPVGQMFGFTLRAAGQGSPLADGILLENSNKTVTGNGVARQVGAVATGQSIYAALHVTSVTGTTPTCTVKIQSDDNEAFTSAVDRITFTQATAATAEFLSLAGPVTDTWWRATVTIGGTGGPTFAIAVALGIK